MRPSIFDVALSYENGNNGVIKSNTNVVVHTNRLWYGNNSTVSAYRATAYDEQGRIVDSIEGYFLEPATNFRLSKVEGKKKAIMSGQYNIIPKARMLKKVNDTREKNGLKPIEDLKYDWYVDSPPGRSFVAIHGGRIWEHTQGCFLPGETFEYNEETKDYKIKNSSTKKKELFDFFNRYGKKGIKIDVGPYIDELY